MKVIKIAQVPAPTILATATVKEAVAALGRDRGCAVAVLDGGRLVGTLSKDDVLSNVVAAGLNPETTTVGQIMMSPPQTTTLDTGTDEALKLMFANRKCYLPIVDSEGALKGWLAICHLFENHVEDLSRELDALEAYICADGPGG
jgi:CBS domain-containing protein